MQRSLFLIGLMLVAAQFAASGAGLSEEEANQKVKKIPEFVAYAKSHKYTLDDNELIQDSKRLPAYIALPAWRIDVRTIVHEPEADHAALWTRFIVASTGEVYVWDPLSDRCVSLSEWRRLNK